MERQNDISAYLKPILKDYIDHRMNDSDTLSRLRQHVDAFKKDVGKRGGARRNPAQSRRGTQRKQNSSRGRKQSSVGKSSRSSGPDGLSRSHGLQPRLPVVRWNEQLPKLPRRVLRPKFGNERIGTRGDRLVHAKRGHGRVQGSDDKSVFGGAGPQPGGSQA